MTRDQALGTKAAGIPGKGPLPIVRNDLKSSGKTRLLMVQFQFQDVAN
jgi:hypothetical protein